MTSMIDVVFLLLIFFLVTTTFVRPEREVVSSIKVKEKSAASTSALEPAMVDVILSQGQPLFRVGAVRTNDLAQVTKMLESFPNKSEGAFVRVDGEVPYEAAAQAIGACRDAGFTVVSYLPLD